MAKNIYFDMDGTLADLYGVEGWLMDLLASNPRPYAEAKPLVNMQRLARRLNLLRKAGYKVCVITWLAKDATAEYDKAVAEVKMAWLKKHLATVTFDEVHILAYGTPKQNVGKGILFDDELPNRENWGEGAYHPDKNFEILGGLN
jgi:hypothetical protein